MKISTVDRSKQLTSFLNGLPKENLPKSNFILPNPQNEIKWLNQQHSSELSVLIKDIIKKKLLDFQI